MADAGVHFVSATYYLEGDGPLIISCYERLSTVAHAVAVEHYSKSQVLLEKLLMAMLRSMTS